MARLEHGLGSHTEADIHAVVSVHFQVLGPEADTVEAGYCQAEVVVELR